MRNIEEALMKKTFLTAMTTMMAVLPAVLICAMPAVLVLGMIAGCSQPEGPSAAQPGAELPPAAEEEGVTYVGATDDNTPVELVIEDDTYVVKVGGEEVSRGTATEAADGTWELLPEDGGDAFTATPGEDGGLTIKGPITDGLDGEDLHELYPVEPPPDADGPDGPDGGTPGLTLSVDVIHVFPSANAGYKAQTAKAVAVTNSGSEATGDLTIEVSNELPYGGFTLSAETIASLAAGKKAAFSVKPNTGLEAGVYTARITVSGDNGISAGFYVRFTVNTAPDAEAPDAPKPDSLRTTGLV
jgi:hypothetical protein